MPFVNKLVNDRWRFYLYITKIFLGFQCKKKKAEPQRLDFAFLRIRFWGFRKHHINKTFFAYLPFVRIVKVVTINLSFTLITSISTMHTFFAAISCTRIPVRRTVQTLVSDTYCHNDTFLSSTIRASISYETILQKSLVRDFVNSFSRENFYKLSPTTRKITT